MASLRQIRSRLRSIGNTQKIMRAMQLVSASKLKRAQNRLVQARSMLDFLDGLLQQLLAQSDGQWDHPLCARHEGALSTLVVFTSDAGLCGAYNTNLIQLAEAHLRRDTLRRTSLIAIGKTKTLDDTITARLDDAATQCLQQFQAEPSAA